MLKTPRLFNVLAPNHVPPRKYCIYQKSNQKQKIATTRKEKKNNNTIYNHLNINTFGKNAMSKTSNVNLKFSTIAIKPNRWYVSLDRFWIDRIAKTKLHNIQKKMGVTKP